MREILFRGKRKDNGEWVCGYYACQSNHSCINRKFCHFILKDECLDIGLGGLEYYEVIPETVGQYTGLPDKDGKRIFEGDIIKSSIDDEIKGTIIFDEYSRFMINVLYDGSFYLLGHVNDGVEVIGNIYDNPKSLKGGTK